MTRFAGVLFDVGGVVVDSPLHAIARYEQELGLPPNAINHAVVAWRPPRCDPSCVAHRG